MCDAGQARVRMAALRSELGMSLIRVEFFTSAETWIGAAVGIVLRGAIQLRMRPRFSASSGVGTRAPLPPARRLAGYDGPRHGVRAGRIFPGARRKSPDTRFYLPLPSDSRSTDGPVASRRRCRSPHTLNVESSPTRACSCTAKSDVLRLTYENTLWQSWRYRFTGRSFTTAAASWTPPSIAGTVVRPQSG